MAAHILSKPAFRAAQPMKQSVRRYATSPSSGGSNVFLYLGGAAVIGGGIWAYRSAFSGLADTKSSWDPLTANKAFKGGDQGFLSLKLDSVEILNHNTKQFRFALPNPDDVGGLPVTSALITKYKGPNDEKPVIRPYTPVSPEDARGHLDFVIKKYEGGPMSTHLHDMEPGQRLDIKGPIPKYPWSPNKHPAIAVIAGGTGITPMYQLLRGIFSNPEDKTKVTLVYGSLTEEDILLKRELEELENTYPNRFRAFYLLDKPPNGWTQGSGHVNKDLLKTVLPFEPKDKDGKIFVCGPPGMYKAVSGTKKSPTDQGELAGILKEMGYEKDQVFKF